MTYLKYTVAAIVTTFLFFLFLNLGNLAGLWQINFWGTKYEDARRNVFENTKSFRDGSNRDIMELCLQYTSTDSPDAKGMIKSTIQQRRLSIPDEALTGSTLSCLTKIGY